jgi:hypothetical protein
VTLEPHQIQGLNFEHMYPVVVWLVKKVVEARRLYGDFDRRHAEYHFGKDNPDTRKSRQRMETRKVSREPKSSWTT